MAITDVVNKINLGVGIAGSAVNAINSLTGAGRNGGSSRFNVQAMASELTQRNGLYKPNLFLVNVNAPNWASSSSTSRLSFICHSASLPGKQITIADDVRLGYGTIDRKVTGMVNPDVPLTFFVANDGEPLTFFNEWLDNILYSDASKGSDGVSPSGVPVMKIRYKSEYETTIEIKLYDAASKEILTYTLYEAFPTQVSDITTEWAMTDQFASVTINFSYRYYTLSKASAPSVNGVTSASGIMTGLKNGLGVINRLATSSTARRAIDLLNIVR